MVNRSELQTRRLLLDLPLLRNILSSSHLSTFLQDTNNLMTPMPLRLLKWCIRASTFAIQTRSILYEKLRHICMSRFGGSQQRCPT